MTATADFAMTSTTLEPTSVLPEASMPEDDKLFEAAVQAARDAAPKAEEEVPPVESPPAESPPAEAAPAAVTPPPVVEEKPAEAPPKVAPVLLKLMEREAQVVERENKVKQFETEVSSIREQVAAYETAQKNFKYNPVQFIRQMAPDIDLADLAKQLWYEKLGDVAPADYRATKEARAAQGSIEQLRAEAKADVERVREEIKREQAEQAYHQYVGAIGSLARSVPETYPLVKSFAKDDPDSVQRGLLKIAQQHAQQTGGQVLTPDECAAKLNEKLAQLQSRLTPATPVAPAPTKNEQPAATLRNKHTSVQPNRTVPNEQDEEALFQRALEAARAVRK